MHILMSTALKNAYDWIHGKFYTGHLKCQAVKNSDREQTAVLRLADKTNTLKQIVYNKTIIIMHGIYL